MWLYPVLAEVAQLRRVVALRGTIIEGMIAFIQEEYPDAFPRKRFSAVGGGTALSSGFTGERSAEGHTASAR